MSCSANISAAYIDLGTFNDLTTEFYHGEDAALRFTQCVDQWTWFSQVPHDLTLCSSLAFNQDGRFELSNIPTYVTSMWMRVVLPAVSVLGGTNAANNTVALGGSAAGAPFFGAWTRNLGHWLAQSYELEINNVPVHCLTSAYLDFFSQFCVPADKRVIYDNMIGNVNELVDPLAAGDIDVSELGAGNSKYDHTIASRVINVPLPFFFTHDDGKALPRAAMHLSRVVVKAKIRQFNHLFQLYENNEKALDVSGDGRPLKILPSANVSGTPALSDGQIFCNAVLTTSDERKLLANCQRKQAVRLLQEQSPVSTTAGASTIQLDLDYAHHISHYFFAMRNTTYDGIRANYTTASPVAEESPVARINFDPSLAVDPIASVKLAYDACPRQDMAADYYSLIQPWYHARCGPEETGYHMYAYGRHIESDSPDGSTDYTQLNRPKFHITTSAPYQTYSAAAGGVASTGVLLAQTFELICYAEYWTLITSGQGQFGFTVA